MTQTEVVALITAGSTTVVAVCGYALNWFGTLRSHRHERELARTARLHDEVRTVYEDVARFTTWLAVFVERTHPIIGPVPPVPAPPTDAQAIDLLAHVAVIGSAEVEAALNNVMGAYQRFKFAADVVDGPAHGREDREELEAARQAFRNAKSHADRLMRSEVRA